MTARRLPKGGRIDRSRDLSFTWDGRPLRGHPGDSLAAALMAGGERIVGRSFKYHRPRGIMSAGVEESGALVTVGSGDRRDPNVRATTQELFEGLSAQGQNAWPNVRFDMGAAAGLFSRFLPSGFYYKTFMGLPPFEWGSGTGYWMVYEKLIRKAAGMGEASRAPDPDDYEHAHAHCDVLVVGAGPAGLNAARAAAGSGQDVVLVEQDWELGGDYLNRGDEKTAATRADLVAAVEAAGVRTMTRTTAFGLYDGGAAGLLERVTDHLGEPPQSLPRQRFWTVRAKRIILATGALERPLAFGNNDRPGVMSAAAARTYLNRYAVLPGERIVVASNNDSAYATASELAGAGAEVTLLDARTDISDERREQASSGAVDLVTGTAPLNALGARGLRGLECAVADGAGWRPGPTRDCDLLLVSGGWSPVVSLLSHRGVKPVWDAETACFLPGATS